MKFLRGSAVLGALAMLVLVVALPIAQAQTFPKLSGRIVDDAHLLDPPQKAAIEAKLASLEKQTQRQLVVVTLPDLQGYDIADYGFRLGDKWGIGDKERDDGALLIIAPKERRVRIEVGYGLEGVLTDALSGRIVRNDITPRFKKGDYPGGINAGVDAITKLLLLPPDQARKLVAQAEQEARASQGNGEILFVLFLLFIFFIVPMFIRGRHGRTYRRGIAPVVLWGPMIGGGSSRSGSWSGGGFSGGGGGFGGGGASGGW